MLCVVSDGNFFISVQQHAEIKKPHEGATMKAEKNFLDSPTFHGVLTFGQKTNGVYIKLQNGEPVKMRIREGFTQVECRFLPGMRDAASVDV
jgi:hypothetical protein